MNDESLISDIIECSKEAGKNRVPFNNFITTFVYSSLSIDRWDRDSDWIDIRNKRPELASYIVKIVQQLEQLQGKQIENAFFIEWVVNDLARQFLMVGQWVVHQPINKRLEYFANEKKEADKSYSLVGALKTLKKNVLARLIEQQWKESLTRLDEFILENQDKQCEFKDYDLNLDRYELYRQQLEEYIRYFSKLELSPIVKYLKYYQQIRYISFEEFKTNLDKSTEALIQYIKQLKADMSVAVVLRLGYPVGKSALWVIRLVYSRLRPYLDMFDCSEQCDYDTYKPVIEKQQIERLLFIYPDDCIYSGSQFYRTIQNDNNTALRDISITNREFVKYYSLCPYVASELTYDPRLAVGYEIKFGVHQKITKLTRMHQVVIGSTINSLINYVHDTDVNALFLREEKLDVDTFDELHLFYRITEDFGLNVYFQHKLADQVSIITSILVYGITPNARVGSLIKNCDYVLEKQYLLKEGIDFSDENDRCPPSCYKRIMYTWKGKQVDSKLRLCDIF
jgi:hypothetical protein